MNFGGRSPKWPRNSFHWFAANRTWKLWRISPSVAKWQVHFCFYDELLDWLPSFGWLYLFVCLAAFSFALLLYFYFMRMKKNFCCLHCAACFVCSALCSISLSSVCSAGKTLKRITQGNASRKNKTKQNVSLSRVKYFHKFRSLIACNVTLMIRTPPSWPLNWLQYFLVDKDKLLI